MLRWEIYYSDGTNASTFTHEDGPPEMAPRDYVQVIQQDEPFQGRRDIISGAGSNYQYFCWHGDRWIIHDESGLAQYRNVFGERAIVLNGFYIEDEKFWTIHSSVVDKPEWQGKDTRLVRASEWAERVIPPDQTDTISE